MEEAIMICIDNSRFAPKYSYLHQIQLEAIRLYAHAKLKSNPNNRLGLATLGVGAYRWPHQPHSDIERFLTDMLDIPWGGDFSLQDCLTHAPFAFAPLALDMKKRMLVFVAGPGCWDDILLRVARNFKRRDVALDVVSFEDEDQEFDAVKTKILKSFVAAANRANNSHFARVPIHSSFSFSVRDILVRSKILCPSEAGADYSQEDPQDEPPSPPSPPPVILPALFSQVHQSQLVFGSWQMHQLLGVLSPSS